MGLYAMVGLIDETEHIQGSKVFLYATKNDSMVNPAISHLTESFYQTWGADVKTKFDLEGEHAIPTDKYGPD